jgi:hypothetical protein
MNAGCFCVLLLVVLAAGGLAWLLVQAFTFLEAHGIAPGSVAVVVVLAFAVFSLYRAKRDGQP